MSEEQLFCLLRERILDREEPSEGKKLIEKFIFPTLSLPGSSSQAIGYEPSRMIELASQVFQASSIFAWTFCELVSCLKILALLGEHRCLRQQGLAYGYVFWEIVGQEDRRGFARAFEAESTLHGRVFKATDETEELAESTDFALTKLLSSFVRMLINEELSPVLRDLYNWAYTSYREHHASMFQGVGSDVEWRARLGNLIPWLMLKNLLPIRDKIEFRKPGIFLFTDVQELSPQGMSDSGRVTRHSRLCRNLFSGEELRRLDLEDQRISELFAHAYANFLNPNHEELFEAIKLQALNVGASSRLAALQYVEMQYRYRLALPKQRYLHIKEAVSSSFG